MTDRIAFAKHHGLGNDFLVIDARALDVERLRAAAPSLCDRHRGVGGDGLLLLWRDAPRPAMRVVNADGSVPEMCGNGLRCFVQWLDDAGLLATERDGTAEFAAVDTDAGTLRCEVFRDAAGRIAEVEVAMGQGRFDPAAVPYAGETALQDATFEAHGHRLRASALSIGNPHLVLFEPVEEAERLRLGPLLERHPAFPARINVEFCAPLPPAADGTAQLQVDVYERGCGWTQACGTGATAVAIAHVRAGRHPADAPLRVRLPGGWLTLRADAEGRGWMRGPTAYVYRGEVALPA